jgi:hypothetical protein
VLPTHIPAELLQPPRGGVPPPVERLEPLAPFRRLEPLDFERLCVSLARREADVEHVQRYGDPGQGQHGIDIYARTSEGSYRAYQSKRYEEFGPADIVRAVDRFLSGTWATRVSAFILCTSASSVRAERAETIEAQAARLRRRGIGFEIWDGEELSDRLKELPIVVLDFFGRAWVERFCTVPLPDSAAKRLDVDELANLRARLERFYVRLFARHRGLLPAEGNGSAVIGLDVLRRRHLPHNESRDSQRSGGAASAPKTEGRDMSDVVTNERVDWLRWLSPSRAV